MCAIRFNVPVTARQQRGNQRQDTEVESYLPHDMKARHFAVLLDDTVVNLYELMVGVGGIVQPVGKDSGTLIELSPADEVLAEQYDSSSHHIAKSCMSSVPGRPTFIAFQSA